MLRQWVCITVLCVVALAPVACKPGAALEAKDSSAASEARAPQNPDVGAPLFDPAKPPAKPPASTTIIDPIVIPAHLTVIDKVDIPSQRDGKILFIGTEAKPGEQLPPGWTYQHPDADTDKLNIFRRLIPGDRVEKGGIVVMLDDREALYEYRSRVSAVLAAQQAVVAGKAMVDITELVRKKQEDLFLKGQTSELEVQKARLDVVRATADYEEKKANEVKAKSERDGAKVRLDMHHIRTPIDGVLQPTNRKNGEAIRAQETVFQIQNIDMLRAEGTVPIGYQYRINRGMEVAIEPSVEVADIKRNPGHAAPITAVAISNHAEPLIVSASEDKYCVAWTLGNERAREFKHDVAVRCVACSPMGAPEHLCLTGADDGKGRIWDLDAKDSPPRVLEEFKHKGVISAVAFAPDGKTCVTADSRDICLWDTATGKLRYRFPSHHLGEITSLTITPQAKLLSSSRDNTIAVWSLGTRSAAMDLVLDGRSGDVAKVGVSHSGQYVVFDIAQSLRIIAIPERQTVAVMQSMTDAYKFASFAYYSPDDKLILTGTNAENRLSVWKAPTAGARAAELRQFVPNERVSFTCAAIYPDSKLPPFAVTGTKEGVLYFWPMPRENEIRDPIKGVITFVDKSADATARQIRVWADFDNTKAQLPPGGAVTLVVNPQPAVAAGQK